ncbi:MAG: SRPBCC family protein [Acidimicrobiia bacterium]
MKLSASTTIQAPIEQVFDGWAALERSPEHQKPTIERTRLDEGPLGAGSRYRAIDQWPGRKVRFEMEITGYERPSLIAARWDEPMNGSWEARFASDDGVTRMDFDTTIEPGGMMGLMAPLMRPWAKRQLAQGLESFRLWVENRSG